MKRFGVLLTLGLLAVIAVATTVSVKGTHAPIVQQAAVSGAGESDGPQSFLDLAASAGQPVTEEQVKRAAAQDAAGSTRWQFVGPSNVAGRVTRPGDRPDDLPQHRVHVRGQRRGVQVHRRGERPTTPCHRQLLETLTFTLSTTTP